MAPTDDSCSLCGLALPAAPFMADEVDGAFCCQGCLAVARALGASELDRSDLEAAREGTEESPEGEITYLAIDGMHCSTCEAFLAARGRRIDGIDAVEASYATDTARVRYDPDQITPDEIAAGLTGYGYRAGPREAASGTDPRGDLWTSFLVGGGFFGMMVMLWYGLFLYPTYFGYDPIVEPGGYDALFIYANIWLFTSFVLFYTGWPLLRGAVVSLRARAPNMDLLVSIAALSAYFYSTVAMLLGRSDLYFDVSVAIVLVVTIGGAYEQLLKRRALADVSVADFEGDESARRPDGEEIAVDALEPGDEVLVRPGERVPLDGTVASGTAAVDTALLTGEPEPETLGPGAAIPGGAIVTDAPLIVTVGAETESTRDRLLASLWSIQTDRPGIQRLADRLATIFVPLVVILAIGIGGILLATGEPPTSALLVSLTVLIVACPCALGLATPLAVAAGVRDGLRRRILIVRSSIFEEAPTVTTVVLDKTGTLTGGEMTVHAVEGEEPDRLLDRAAAVERYSEHPIARAICDAAGDRPVRANGGAVDTIEPTGRGIEGTVDGESVTVGHPDLLRDRGYSIPERFANRSDRVRDAGHVPVMVGWNGAVRGVIVVGDAPRPGWEQAIDRLAEGRDVVVLTGDAGPAADRFRDHPGVDRVFVGVPPEGKAATVKRLQERGPVAMVGDGSNDAPGIAAADVGIAISGGTALAIDAADAVIQGEDLAAVADLFDVVSGTNRRIRGNLSWAFVYNGIAIPLAIAGLLNPLLAAVAMATSSVLVVTNTARPVVRRS